MKKYLCLLISILMLSSVSFAEVSAGTEYTDPTDNANLIFDLDIAGYDGSNAPQDLKKPYPTQNAVDNGQGADSVYNRVWKSGTPSKLEIEIPETTKKVGYVSFQSDSGYNTVSVFRTWKGVNNLMNKPASSVETWIRPVHNSDYEIDSNEDTIFSVQSQVSGASDGFGNSLFYATVKYEDNKYILTLNGNSENLTYDITALKDKWIHLIFTREYTADGLTLKAYMNGGETPVISKTYAGVTQASEDNYRYCIGSPGQGNTNINNVFRGGMAAFRIYDKALSSTEAKNNFEFERYNYEKAPLKPLDKGVVFDLDINNETGALTDVAALIKDPESGRTVDTIAKTGEVSTGTHEGMNEAFDYVRFNTEPPHETTSAFKQGYLKFSGVNVIDNPEITVEMWARPTIMDGDKEKDYYWGNMFIFENKAATSSNQCFMRGVAQNDGTIQFGYYGYSADRGGNSNQQAKSYTTSDISTELVGVWSHYVFTKSYSESENSITFKMYINGSLMKEETISGNETVTIYDPLSGDDGKNIDFYIGGSKKDSWETFIGDIADFRIYNYELTSDNIYSEYTNGVKGKYYTPQFSLTSSDNSIDVDNASFNLNGTAMMGDDAVAQFSISNLGTNEALKTEDYILNVADDKKSFALNFNRYFSYGDKFKISTDTAGTKFNYLEIEKGDFEIVNQDGTDYTKPTLSELAGGVKFAVKNAGSGTKSFRYSIVAKRDGRTAELISVNETSVSAGAKADVTKTLTKLGVADEVIIYIWEISGHNLIPVLNSPIVIK